MSGGVGNDIFKTGVVENVRTAVGIALRALSVQKLFPLPVSTSGFHFRFLIDILSSGCRQMLAVPFLGLAWSKMCG